MIKGLGLLIAEKHSAMVELQNVYERFKHELPYKLEFEKFHGHVTRLPMPEEFNADWKEWKEETLPMIPTDWYYKPEDNRDRYDAVRKKLESGRYDFIINAADFEREGELIFHSFFSTLNETARSLPVYRLWGSDLSDNTIRKGLQSLLALDDHLPNTGTVRQLGETAVLRARLDWLLGMNTSRLLTLRGKRTVHSGRVKLPILKLVVDRELAINRFVVKEYYTIKALLETKDGSTLEAFLVDEEGKNKQFDKKEDALAFINKLKSESKATVSTVKKQTKKENPPELFDLAALQSAAANNYGIKPAASLESLQRLYEQKLTSYPRTDSNKLTEEEARNGLDGILDTAYQLEEFSSLKKPTDDQKEAFFKNKRYVNDKEVAAHSALTPVAGSLINTGRLTEQDRKVFYLIARSVILPFYGPVVKEATELTIMIGNESFISKGSVLKDKGWSELVPEYKTRDTVLPALLEKDELTVVSLEEKEGKTTPPPRYSVETLSAVLKNVHRLIDDEDDKAAIKKAEGLGRPSTRTAIIDELIKNGYLQTKGKKLEYHPSELGIALITSLGDSVIVSPTLTASWETKLQSLEHGETTFLKLYNEVVEYTNLALQQLETIELVLPKQEAESFGEYDGESVFKSNNGYYTKPFIEYLQEKKENESAQKRGLWIPVVVNNSVFKTDQFTKKDVTALLEGKTVNKNSFIKKDKTKRLIEFELLNGGLVIKKKTGSLQKEELVIAGYSVSLINYEKDGKKGSFYTVQYKGKELKLNSTIAGVTITTELLEQLLTNGKTNNELQFNSAKGPFKAFLVIKDNQLAFERQAVEEKLEFEGNSFLFYRRKNDKGEYYFIKQTDGKGTAFLPVERGGHVFTQEELLALVQGNRVLVTNLVSKKTGSVYPAYFQLENGSLKQTFA